MSGKFVTITNHKGGVGKTTTTYTLALGLAHRGYRVVMVDADAQATLTEGALGFEASPGFYNLIARNEEFKNILLPIPQEWYTFDNQQPLGEAFLIPGNGETRHIANSVSDPNVIRDKFAPLLQRWVRGRALPEVT